jgi:hypothetical protein
MAESFVDSFKTELITDRAWHSRSQLELAIVEYTSWFNESRLHENLDNRPPSEIEELYAEKTRPTITTSRKRKPTNPASVKPGPAHPDSRESRRLTPDGASKQHSTRLLCRRDTALRGC